MITLSVISHGQTGLVENLLSDIQNFSLIDKIIITENLPAPPIQIPPALEQKIMVIKNIKPKGFGHNHNQAFFYNRSPYYCVINPDIRLKQNIFLRLLEVIKDNKLSLIAPEIVSPDGQVEDSCREYPSVGKLIKRRFSTKKTFLSKEKFLTPDWIAGMFLLFNSVSFKSIGGFDQRFFMYCEDVDISMRITKRFSKPTVIRDVTAIHDARRDSHRKIKYLAWHVSSLLKLWHKYLR